MRDLQIPVAPVSQNKNRIDLEKSFIIVVDPNAAIGSDLAVESLVKLPGLFCLATAMFATQSLVIQLWLSCQHVCFKYLGYTKNQERRKTHAKVEGVTDALRIFSSWNVP